MACYRSCVRVGLKRGASALSGIGLATLLASATADTASARSVRAGESVSTTRPATAAVMAVVSLNQQRVTVYDSEGQVLQAPVSTGQTGYETPAGIFTVLERKVEHTSNLYDDASMPFMQRLTWSGIALHAGVLPGHPASHGCIRMPLGFAERLFERTRLGMRVIVVRDDIAPAAFTHPTLFKPLLEDAATAAAGVDAGGGGIARVADASAAVHAVPSSPRRSVRAVAAAKAAAAASAAEKAEEARTAARTATIEAARATKAIRKAEAVKARTEQLLRRAEQQLAGAGGADSGEAAARAQQARDAAQAAFDAAQAQLGQVKAEMQPKVDLAPRLRELSKVAHAASAAAQDEAKEAARKAAPVSVFISRATQRLYVRQSREPVLDVPVGIAEPDKPLGTYVFTALGYAGGEADLRWSAVSMYRSVGERLAGGKRGERRQAEAAPADLAGARHALDRIAIPKEASDRIAEMVGPGTSVIVSDESLSKETGQATEFIVVMSNEPQGGLKIRRRPQGLEARYRQQRPYGGPFGWSGGPFPWWR
jgi:hypothetical protein